MCPLIPESFRRLLLVWLGGDETQGVATAWAQRAVISETAFEKCEDDGGIWAGPVPSWDCIPAIISRGKPHCISGKAAGNGSGGTIEEQTTGQKGDAQFWDMAFGRNALAVLQA